MQNTPHTLSKHPSMAGGMDSAAHTPSPPRGAAGDSAAAAAMSAAGAAAAGRALHSHAGAPNGDSPVFPNSSSGGVQLLSGAGASDVGQVCSSSSMGGARSLLGGSQAGMSGGGLSAGIR